MAIDAALLDRARTGGAAGDGLLRIYGWSAPTVSLGRNERTSGRFDAASLASVGFEAVRRPTGGRALLHGDEVTYAIAIPLADGVPWRHAYRAVNALLVGAMQSLGVDARLAGADDVAPVPVRPDGPACFDTPSEGEIVVGHAKLVGSAVWRDRGAYLQHGSILLRDRQAELARAALAPMPPTPPAAALAALCPGLVADDVVRAISTTFAAMLDTAIAESFGTTIAAHGSVTPFVADPSFETSVAGHMDVFRSSAWLWRR